MPWWHILVFNSFQISEGYYLISNDQHMQGQAREAFNTFPWVHIGTISNDVWGMYVSTMMSEVCMCLLWCLRYVCVYYDVWGMYVSTILLNIDRKHTRHGHSICDHCVMLADHVTISIMSEICTYSMRCVHDTITYIGSTDDSFWPINTHTQLDSVNLYTHSLTMWTYTTHSLHVERALVCKILKSRNVHVRIQISSLRTVCMYTGVPIMCVYIYTHTYTHMQKHAYFHTQRHTYMYIYIYTHIVPQRKQNVVFAIYINIHLIYIYIYIYI